MKKTAQRIHRHILNVQDCFAHIIRALSDRSRFHDRSKFNDNEFDGFMRFELMPESLPYGSLERQAMMKAIMTDNYCFTNHAKVNDHHPEHYLKLERMGFLQIQEMVCDWAGAHMEKSNGTPWPDSVLHNIQKYDFSDGQIWLIHQVAEFLMVNIGRLQEGALAYPKIVFSNASEIEGDADNEKHTQEEPDANA